jgi:hypothetical protein
MGVYGRGVLAREVSHECDSGKMEKGEEGEGREGTMEKCESWTSSEPFPALPRVTRWFPSRRAVGPREAMVEGEGVDFS